MILAELSESRFARCPQDARDSLCFIVSFFVLLNDVQGPQGPPGFFSPGFVVSRPRNSRVVHIFVSRPTDTQQLQTALWH